MRRGQRANSFASAVSRSIINEDDFAERNLRLLDLFNQRHDVVHFLQGRDDDRGWHGVGADDGIRTRDLLITNQLLYQLSYVGAFCVGKIAVKWIFREPLSKPPILDQTSQNLAPM